MKQKLKRMLSKRSLFWRYFFFLAVVMLLFLGSLIVTSSQFSNALEEAYLNQARSSFEQNSEAFSRDLLRIHVMPTFLEESKYYSSVADAAYDPSNPSYAVATILREEYSTRCILLGMPSQGFVYFKKPQLMMTYHRLFPEAEDYFTSYVVYEGQGTSVLDMLKAHENRSLTALPAAQVSVDGAEPEQHLTVLIRGTDKNAVYGFLLSEQEVLESFHTEALPENTNLKMVRDDGTVLFSHGEDTDGDFAWLTARASSISATVTLGIPRDYFSGIVREAQAAMHLVFLFSVVIGVLLCVVLSHASVRPFRRLIKSHTAHQTAELEPANELATIDQFLRSAQQKTAALRSMLLSSLLIRAFSGLHIPDSEYEKLSAALPAFQRPMQVAVVRDSATGENIESHSSMMNLLRGALPEQFLCEYINEQEALVLFQADGAVCELLQHVIMDINRENEQQPRFVCGVSAPFTGLTNISGAIRQAQFCVPEMEERMVILFAEDNSDKGKSGTEMAFDFRRFQQALAGWSQQGVLDQIEHFAVAAGKGNMARPEEVFYSVLFLLRDAAYNGKISFEEHKKTAYQHNMSPAANLRRLKEIAEDMFRQKAELLMLDKQQLCKDITQYIEANFHDTSLCQSALAQLFCVSERFVYNAVQSVTGMGFSSFITATRMKEAARLLRETDANIGEIAAQCGYPVESTFYRNFKKHYGITPIEFKNSAS